MKYSWDKKYLYWGVTALSVIFFSLLIYFILFRMDSIFHGIKTVYNILMPLIFGGIISYILIPIVNFMEKKLIHAICRRYKIRLRGSGKKAVRLFCVFVSLIFLIYVIYALLALLIPQLVTSISMIAGNFSSYLSRAEVWVNAHLENYPELESFVNTFFDQYSVRAQEWLSGTLLPRANNMLLNFSSGVWDLLIILKNLLIGMMISIYILYNKEKFAGKGKRILFSLFKPAHANKIIYNLRFINRVFGGFLSGKIFDSIIIGILCYIGISLLKIPYAVLISVIVGVTNVIPFFGPYLGAVPSAFLILLVSPIHCLYFVIFILILQQLDGNFIGPKILGDSTGLSSFMVIVAILVGGGIFGIWGMVVGVPVFAVITALGHNAMVERLRKRNLPEDEETYIYLEAIDEKTHRAILFDKSGQKDALQEGVKEKKKKKDKDKEAVSHDKK